MTRRRESCTARRACALSPRFPPSVCSPVRPLGLLAPEPAVRRSPRAPDRVGAPVACWAWRARRARCSPLAGRARRSSRAAALLLAVDAWQRAWRPPLRVAFEELARVRARARPRATAAGCRKTTKRSRSSTGVLRADAVADADRRLAQRRRRSVDRPDLGRCPTGRSARRHGPSDPASPSVGRRPRSPSSARSPPSAMGEWRAGRRVRAAGAASPAVALSRSRRARSRARARAAGDDARRHGEERRARRGRRARQLVRRGGGGGARVRAPRHRGARSAAGAAQSAGDRRRHRHRRPRRPRRRRASGGCRRRAPIT